MSSNLYSTRGPVDLIIVSIYYFILLIFVWGFAMSWYFNEIGAFSYRELPGYEIYEGEFEEFEDDVAKMPRMEEIWNPGELLKKGQEYEYDISASKKTNLIYRISDEYVSTYKVQAEAQIKTEASVKTNSMIMTLNVRDLWVYEDFSVDKNTGLPTSSKYTTNYWNMQSCHPVRYYFLKGRLIVGNSWWVPRADARINITGGIHRSGFYTYDVDVYRGDEGPDRLYVSKDLPLLVGFEGRDCFSSEGNMTTKLVRVRTESGSNIDIVEELEMLKPRSTPDPNETRYGKWR